MDSTDKSRFYVVHVYGRNMDIIKESVVTVAELDDTISLCRSSTGWKMIAVFDSQTKQAVSLIKP